MLVDYVAAPSLLNTLLLVHPHLAFIFQSHEQHARRALLRCLIIKDKHQRAVHLKAKSVQDINIKIKR